MNHRFVLFLLFCCSLYAKGQTSFGLKWKAEKDTVSIGEPFNLELRLPEAKLKKTMVWPEFADSLGAFELLQVQWLDSADLRFGILMQAVVYDSGTVQIPGISLGFIDGLETLMVEIPSHTIEVLAPQVNMEADFQDILANPDPGYHWHEYLPWLGLLALMILLALALWLIVRKRKQPKPQPLAPKIDPFDAAMDALNQLKELQGSLSNAQIKEFYTQTVDVLRTLVDQVYDLDVSEMTSSEWLALWKRRPEQESTGIELNYVLHIADLVKFAKQQPGPAERNQLIEAAVAFVQACRRYSHSLTTRSHE